MNIISSCIVVEFLRWINDISGYVGARSCCRMCNVVRGSRIINGTGFIIQWAILINIGWLDVAHEDTSKAGAKHLKIIIQMSTAAAIYTASGQCCRYSCVFISGITIRQCHIRHCIFWIRNRIRYCTGCWTKIFWLTIQWRCGQVLVIQLKSIAPHPEKIMEHTGKKFNQKQASISKKIIQIK